MTDELLPPPTTEEEEIERRHRISLAELIRWYREQGKPLDVPLTLYRARGSYGKPS